MREERYDLAVLERDRDSAVVRSLFETLNSSQFARSVAGLCAYDTHDMGKVVARIS